MMLSVCSHVQSYNSLNTPTCEYESSYAPTHACISLSVRKMRYKLHRLARKRCRAKSKQKHAKEGIRRGKKRTPRTPAPGLP